VRPRGLGHSDHGGVAFARTATAHHPPPRVCSRILLAMHMGTLPASGYAAGGLLLARRLLIA
jgi:hypothetical protein